MNGIALAHPFLVQPLADGKNDPIASLGLSDLLAQGRAGSLGPKEPEHRRIKIEIGAERGGNVEGVGLVEHLVFVVSGKSAGEAIHPLSLIRDSFFRGFRHWRWPGKAEWLFEGEPKAAGSVLGRMRRPIGSLCLRHVCFLRPRLLWMA
jgi:hypothetical protein